MPKKIDIDIEHLRFPLSIFIGMGLASVGVFLFSNWVYKGIDFQTHVLELLSSGDTFGIGMYELLGSPFMVNFFSSSQPGFRDIVWPFILTWCATGFIAGTIATKPIRGLKSGAIITISLFILWIIFGFIAGENMGSVWRNSGVRFGQLFSALIISTISSGIAGSITR